ncbi:MAG: hypothetical protein AAGA54_03645 [Myxococcota bacterium]
MFLHRVFSSACAAALLVTLSACKPSKTAATFDPADPAAAAAALREHLEEHPDDVEARRDLAHIEWMWLNEADAATANLDRLVAGGDPPAMLSRLLMARARDDAPTVATLAYGLVERASAADGADDAFTQAAADVAARTLQQTHGERPDDDARFIAFFEAHEADFARLPFSVRQPLLSLRASIARRLGQPYKSYFEEQGCVQAWQASTVWGRLGDYELPRAQEKPFTLDDKASIVPLSCVVRVWNPTEQSGVRTLRTTLTSDDDTIVLDLSAQESMRVWLDGTLIHRTDRTDAYAARRARVAVPVNPGTHVLELATAIPRDKAWVLVRAADGDGDAIEAVAGGSTEGAGVRGDARTRRPPWPAATSEDGPLQGPLYAPLRDYLAVEAALADGDGDTAERHVAGLADALVFPEGLLMQAAFERNDRSRPRTNSASREQTALQTALELQPQLGQAQGSLLELLLRRGDDTEATAMLEGLPDASLRTVEGELLRYQIHRARGKEHLAKAALDRAKALDPEHCKVLRFERAQARDIRDVRTEDALVEALGDCAGSLQTQAELAETRGDWEAAKTAWMTALERKPDDLEALDAMARLAIRAGDVPTARQYIERALALSPLRVGSHVVLADLALSEGKRAQAQAQLDDALALVPFSNTLRRMAADLGREDDLMAYRVDGLAAVKAYQASGATYEGAGEALVLDRSVVRVYEGGGLRQVVHIVVHLLSKEALDRYGELDTPPGAELLTLRSFKPDGQIFEPELVPGKDGVSLRHLEVGDFVEYEYVLEEAPSGVVPDYVDVSTFRFQSFDVPYHRSELLVLHPPATPLKFDRRNTPPDMETRTVSHGGKDLTLLTMGVDEMPRLGVEPGARSLLEEVPNVRIFTEVDTSAWLESLAASVYYARRMNPELQAEVRRLTKGTEGPEETLRRLWTWVVENVDDGGDLSSAATATYATRRGSRLVLLAAMLDEAGVDSELWLARNRHGPAPLPGGHPMIENYDAAMLAVPLPGRSQPLMVMTASKVMPLGYLPPGYDDTKALRIPVRPGDAAGVVDVPAPPPNLADRRIWDLDVDVDVLGDATVTGSVTLFGGEAIAWRQALREVDEDRIQEIFQQAELGWLRGNDLRSLEVRGADDLDAPLELAFEATTAALGVVQNGALLLQADLVPLDQASRYVALPTRVTGMVVPYAPVHEATVRVRLRDGRFSEVPEPLSLTSDFGAFERTVDGRAGASEVQMRYRSTLTTGVIEARKYRTFADFARAVETATGASLRAEPG